MKFNGTRIRSLSAFVAVILFTLTGCGGGLKTSYGPSKGILAKRSVNGFTTLRSAFIKAGFSHRDLNRLTDRARSSAVIVWTPGHPTGIEAKTTAWMERWLKIGNKTLIYVIPDSGSESQFYRDARPIAAPQQRLEYRRKYAESLIREHQWQLQRTALPTNGWFFVKPKVQNTKTFLADSESSRDHAWKDFPQSDKPCRVEWVLEDFDRKNKLQNGTPIWQPVGPGSSQWSFSADASPTATITEFEPLVVSEDRDTLVARVTSNSWQGSQILVVAGGSLLTNFGLTQPENQRLAEHLILSSFEPMMKSKRVDRENRLLTDGSQPQVSFANADYALPISDRAGEVPRASGAELFTEYPLSFVTFHIAILGFVICLILSPIFGRPKRIERGVLTHFGDHLTAVATLMRRRGGETFARRRISEYMKHVRDETSGPWVIEDPSHSTDPALHLHIPGSKRLEDPTDKSPQSIQPTIAVQEPSDRLTNDSNQPDRG